MRGSRRGSATRSGSHRRAESVSGATSARGSVGSAKVWDASTRARRRAQEPQRPAPGTGMSEAELEALVAGIVQVTLDTRLSDWDRGRRAALGEELRSRLLAIFGHTAPAEPPGSAVEEAAEEGARSELDASAAGTPPEAAPVVGSPLEQGPPPDLEQAASRRPEPSPAAQRLESLLGSRLAQLGSPALARADLRELLVRLAQHALEELPPEGPPPDTQRLDQLDLLQRRAAKLERSLKEARSALAYVSGLEHVDTGLASIYRVVQGLSPDATNREAKKAYLERIFQANLELRRRISK